MSYNIMGKNASFKGDVSGTIENQVNDWDNQSISGNKTFTAAITSSADVMLSGSGKVSASFFYGDGTNLSGVGGTPGGNNREVQFNNSSAFGASANFKFTAANELQVAGQISASLGVSGSEFHGDGSNLTAVTASFVTASNVDGILNASQVNIGDGLEDSSNAIRVKLTSNSGLGRAAGGMSLDVFGLTNGSYSDTSTIALGVSSGTTEKITLSTLASNIEIDGGQITGANSISTSVLPVNITASGHVSASAFFGDGSALDGVTATPTPAGANTQIQFNDGGSLAGDADLTFIKGTNTLATTIVSASTHVSASEFATAGGTVIDSSANFAGNNASFNEITASGHISSSANIKGASIYGDGSNLTGLAVASYSDYTENRILAAGAASDAIKGLANVTFNNPTLSVVGNVSASTDVLAGGNISGSAFHTLNGITAAGGGGSDLVFLDSNGNVTAGGIEMISDGSLVFNFNDNSISGSGNISGSAFYGDGSNLQNVSATPQYRYYTYMGYIGSGAGDKWMYSRTNNTSTANAAASIFLKWIAPGSGSLVRWVITPVQTNAVASNGGYVRTSFLKNNITTNAATQIRTAHVTGAFDITRVINSTSVSASVIDWTGTNLTVSGTNSFDPGDVLMFGINPELDHGDCAVSIVFKIDESIDYP